MSRLDRTVVETGSGPTAATVTVSGLSTTAVRVDWIGATGGVQGIKSYKLYLGSSAGSLSLVATFSRATTSWTVSGLTAGTTYYARVDAVDGYGNTAASSVASGATQSVGGGDPTAYPLLSAASTTLLGTFSLPVPNPYPSLIRYGYGGKGMALSEDRQSLYITCHESDAKFYVGRVGIPTLVNGSGSGTNVQSPVAVPNTYQTASAGLSGALVHNGRLILTANYFYNFDATAGYSHSAGTLTAGGDINPSAFTQAQKLSGTPNGNRRFIDRYMGVIPAEWRPLFGNKPCFTGNSAESGAAVGSAGPGLWAFDPDELGSANPSCTPLLYYGDPTKGCHGPGLPYLTYRGYANEWWAWADAIRKTGGFFWPSGTRSVLFVHVHGYGEPKYGSPTSDPALDGTPNPSGDIWVYNPCGGGKGDYAYPNRLQILAFDANEFIAARAGQKQFYDITPYAYWEMPGNWGVCPYDTPSIAFDHVSSKLYVFLSNGESPRVAVFQMSIA